MHRLCMVYAWCVQERALQILKAKLLIVQREQQVEALAEIRGDQVLAEWGQQIRSYVLAPYKMVKDLRTQHETSQVSVATTSISYCLLATSCLLPTVPCYSATVLPCNLTGAGRARRQDRALCGRVLALARDTGTERTVRPHNGLEFFA